MKPTELLRKYAAPLKKVTFSVAVKSVSTNDDEQIVYGEVYAPYVIDSHGDMMLPEDVRLMAHRFVSRGLIDQIDVMHDNKVIKAAAVESFIARAGDPVFNTGAWVMGTKIDDREVWLRCKRGDLAAYSFEAMVRKDEADIELLIQNQVFGYTEKALDHEHAFFVELGDDGRVVGGRTSKAADGHYHVIKFGTRTEVEQDHTHRYFLP